MLLDGRAHRVLAGEHRHDVVARDELEVVDHAHRRRVGDGDGELPSVALERKHGVLRRQLRRNELQQARVDLEPREVDCRHAILAREHLDDFGLGHEAHLDQRQAKPLSRGLRLFLQRLGKVLAAEEPLAHEKLAQPFGDAPFHLQGWSSHGCQNFLSGRARQDHGVLVAVHSGWDGTRWKTSPAVRAATRS